MGEAASRHQKQSERSPRSYPKQNALLALNDLAASFVTKFGQTGQLRDLDEAVTLYREAFEAKAVPRSFPRSNLSLNLAGALKTRFERTGRLADLDEAVVLTREALELARASGVDRTHALSSLGTALQRRFEVTNQSDDLYEAVHLHRKALNLRTTTNPSRSALLHNLAFARLMVFHNLGGNAKYLDRTIRLIREAIELQPSPRFDTLRCLADALYQLYDMYRDDSDDSDYQRHDMDDSDDSYDSDDSGDMDGSEDSEDSDQLEDPTAPTEEEPTAPTKEESTAKLEEAILRIEEAIKLNREAIELLPTSHPNRASLYHDLAQNLVLRREMFPETEFPGSYIELLVDAVMASQKAVKLLPEGHPARCQYSMEMGRILLIEQDGIWKYGTPGPYVEEAMAAFRAATSCESAPVWLRFQAATRWAEAASRHASRHNSACEAYQNAIELRIQLAPLHLDLESRKTALETHDSLLREAITCAVQWERFDKAVEFFEGRRAVFWSQARQLRPPMDELSSVAPELAQKLDRLSRELEQGSRRSRFSHTRKQTVLKEKEALSYRRLHEDWSMVVAEVRKLDGFKDFLLPKPFSTLQNAAANGPVVILIPGGINENYEDGSIALVVTSSGVKNLPLPSLTPELADTLSDLTRRVIEPRGDDKPIKKSSLKLLLNKFPPLGSLLQRPQTSPNISYPAARATHLASLIVANSEDIFQCVLAILWKATVESVVRFLNLEISESPPRLWWCPTGVLATLPIHAAGIYGVDGSECVSDYVVSSYTPSLSALLTPPPLPANPLKVMVVIQPHTPDHQPLPYTIEELHAVKKYVPNKSLITFGTPGAPALVEEVLSCLSTVSIAHFACHGETEEGIALDSAFILHDGEQLMLSRIMELATPSASLAFLCACHSARTDKEDVDEAVNLAATMLFAGFRGVVGTMWSISDEDGPNVADSFYRHLFQPVQPVENAPHPDATQAARALHLAVTKLRSEGCSLKRWVPFIHFGL